ncbi:hypothetical protein BDN67DRAFT_986151 [Paxillus ammoniavirescens]|nr:hypothetical protein BDN67DRAFT_986151 [Paxillus ammoniavirescens]
MSSYPKTSGVVLKISAGDKYGCVDIKQLDAFLDEYHKTSVLNFWPTDVSKFTPWTSTLPSVRLGIKTKRKHTSLSCKMQGLRKQRDELTPLLQGAFTDMAHSIFARLQDLGYEAEINHFGKHHIEGFQRSLFKNWDRVPPQLEQQMNDCRKRRLEEAVYKVAESSWSNSTMPVPSFMVAVIELFKEAAYVVRACGLDPHIATVEDMDKASCTSDVFATFIYPCRLSRPSLV